MSDKSIEQLRVDFSDIALPHLVSMWVARGDKREIRRDINGVGFLIYAGIVCINLNTEDEGPNTGNEGGLHRRGFRFQVEALTGIGASPAVFCALLDKKQMPYRITGKSVFTEAQACNMMPEGQDGCYWEANPWTDQMRDKLPNGYSRFDVVNEAVERLRQTPVKKM